MQKPENRLLITTLSLISNIYIVFVRSIQVQLTPNASLPSYDNRIMRVCIKQQFRCKQSRLIEVIWLLTLFQPWAADDAF